MAKENIKFLLIREVKSPSRAYEFDAGIDFFVPEFNSQFIDDLLEKNKKTFKKTLNNKEIEEQKPKHEGTGSELIYNNLSGGITFDSAAVGTVGTDSKIVIKNAPRDFFGFDIEKGEPYFILSAGHGVIIPSGIKCRMAKSGRALIAANKSGIATKNLLTFGAQVVDYSYKGEIHLHLINNSSDDVKIYQNQKILQFLETPIFSNSIDINKTDINKLSEDDFYKDFIADRIEGGFGSTD